MTAEIIPFPCPQNAMAALLYELAERAHNGEFSGLVIGLSRTDGDVETVAACANFADRTDIISAINDARTLALISANYDE